MTPVDTITEQKIVTPQAPVTVQPVASPVRRTNAISLQALRAQDAKRAQEQDKRNAMLFPRDTDYG